MSHSRGMLDDMEFENQLTGMGDNQPELIKFVARQQFQSNKVLLNHDNRIKRLEGQSNRRLGMIGSGGAILGAIVAGIADYFIRRG